MPKNHIKDPAWSSCGPCPEKDGYVSCTLCKGQVSLGPNQKNRSIGSFKEHIKNRHFSLWEELYNLSQLRDCFLLVEMFWMIKERNSKPKVSAD